MQELDKTRYAFFALNREWVITFANVAAARLLNSSPRSLIGSNLLSRLPDEPGNFFQACQYAMENQTFVYVESTTSRGEFEHFIYPSRHGLSVYSTNVSSKRLVEKKLRESEATLNAAVAHTEILMWSLDRSLRLVSFNRPLQTLVFQNREMDLHEGDDVTNILLATTGPERLARWKGCLERVLLGATVILEQQLFGQHFQCSLSPIREADGVVGISVVAYNTSDQKKNERALAEAYKQIGELKLMALRSAMNPHFIFNILNSIQYYILESDTLNAVRYLAEFSKLIRSILENAANNSIRVAEELETLKLYVNLEKMRLENRFEFHLQVDGHVDLNARIPSMILQPFIENAIIHGLAHKKTPGTLQVRIREEGKEILCEVEDDGIGRAAASHLRQRSLPHKPRATAMTIERINLLNMASNASISILDKHDRDGNPTGTLVRIRLKPDTSGVSDAATINTIV